MRNLRIMLPTKKFAIKPKRTTSSDIPGENLGEKISPSKKKCLICLNESPLKMMRNACDFTFKVLFVLMIFKFLY